jgi:hypothetical protein
MSMAKVITEVTQEQIDKSNAALVDALLQRMHPEQMMWHYKNDPKVRAAITAWACNNQHLFTGVK